MHSVLVTDPNVSIDPAVRVHGNIHMRINNVPQTFPTREPSNVISNLAVDIVPGSAAAAPQVVMQRPEHISEILIA
jgi:hypothetical protein